jgi:hypothetical protein
MLDSSMGNRQISHHANGEIVEITSGNKIQSGIDINLKDQDMLENHDSVDPIKRTLEAQQYLPFLVLHYVFRERMDKNWWAIQRLPISSCLRIASSSVPLD